MASEHMVPVQQFCIYHEVEVSFVESLNESGLVHLVKEDKGYYIDEEDLTQLERYVRLHHELEINLPGIEVVSHLLGQIKNLQEEIRVLRNRLF
jgi:hypothetical protein